MVFVDSLFFEGYNFLTFDIFFFSTCRCSVTCSEGGGAFPLRYFST